MNQRSSERMPDFGFRVMSALMNAEDALFPRIDRRVQTFGIQPGMTIVDYGCGPGRYTVRFSRMVGETGHVFAVDIHELAIQAVQERIERGRLTNVTPVLAQGYHSTLPDKIADVVCALDMFFGLREPTTFLREVYRITKDDGFLLLDDGHESRERTLQKIRAAGNWHIVEATPDHLKCRKVL